MDMSLSKLRELVIDREAWRVAVYGITESGTTEQMNWTEGKKRERETILCSLKIPLINFIFAFSTIIQRVHQVFLPKQIFVSLCALRQSQCMHPNQCVSINRWKYASWLMSNIRVLLILFHQTLKPTHFLPWFLFFCHMYLWIVFNLQRWDDHLPFKHIAKTAVIMADFC